MNFDTISSLRINIFILQYNLGQPVVTPQYIIGIEETLCLTVSSTKYGQSLTLPAVGQFSNYVWGKVI